MENSVFFQGDSCLVRVRQKSGTKDSAATFVVSFDFKNGLEGDFFGEEFFVKNDINAIGIKTKDYNWWQNDEVLQATQKIRSAFSSKKLISYGGSMGGYGALNFSEDLGVHSVIAFSPQFSIDVARKVPFEDRWLESSKRLDFKHDKIDRIQPLNHGYIIFDPFSRDALHAQMILEKHRLLPVLIPGADHHPMRFLREIDLLSQIQKDMIFERFDLQDFYKNLGETIKKSEKHNIVLSTFQATPPVFLKKSIALLRETINLDFPSCTNPP